MWNTLLAVWLFLYIIEWRKIFYARAFIQYFPVILQQVKYQTLFLKSLQGSESCISRIRSKRTKYHTQMFWECRRKENASCFTYTCEDHVKWRIQYKWFIFSLLHIQSANCNVSIRVQTMKTPSSLLGIVSQNDVWTSRMSCGYLSRVWTYGKQDSVNVSTNDYSNVKCHRCHVFPGFVVTACRTRTVAGVVSIIHDADESPPWRSVGQCRTSRASCSGNYKYLAH
jgi:hypothetical protein